MVMVYVDDLSIIAKNKIVLNQVITLIESIYQVENLGLISQLLGIQFHFTEQGVTLPCPKYIENCMKRFNLFNNTKVLITFQPRVVISLHETPTNEKEKDLMEQMPYRSLLGCLQYIAGRC